MTWKEICRILPGLAGIWYDVFQVTAYRFAEWQDRGVYDSATTDILYGRPGQCYCDHKVGYLRLPRVRYGLSPLGGDEQLRRIKTSPRVSAF